MPSPAAGWPRALEGRRLLGSSFTDGAPVLVAHSTPVFARPHLPELRWSRVQRWTYAKPVSGREAV